MNAPLATFIVIYLVGGFFAKKVDDAIYLSTCSFSIFQLVMDLCKYWHLAEAEIFFQHLIKITICPLTLTKKCSLQPNHRLEYMQKQFRSRHSLA